MSAQRIQAALLVAGLVAADLAAVQFTRTGRVEFIGLILIGLAAATVGGLGLLAAVRSGKSQPEDKTDAAPASSGSFGLRSLMLVTAMVAVWLTAIAATRGTDPHVPSYYPNGDYFRDYNDWSNVALDALYRTVSLAPIVFPLVGFAYMAGRRSVDWRAVIAFVLLEAAAVAGFYWAIHQSLPPW